MSTDKTREHYEAMAREAAATADGGQAFPIPVAIGPNGEEHDAYPGMTLRDYFAAKAMRLVDREWDTPHDDQLLAIAQLAYRIADAMLAARAGGAA